jgi:hypothetical protein
MVIYCTQKLCPFLYPTSRTYTDSTALKNMVLNLEPFSRLAVTGTFILLALSKRLASARDDLAVQPKLYQQILALLQLRAVPAISRAMARDVSALLSSH